MACLAGHNAASKTPANVPSNQIFVCSHDVIRLPALNNIRVDANALASFISLRETGSGGHEFDPARLNGNGPYVHLKDVLTRLERLMKKLLMTQHDGNRRKS
ncbi:hypothetical protein J1G33_22000 [Pseudomonas sp. P867]|jgi:hypothetical protein|uniref:hypothetical protein n=1 Tax=Pseudomonas TaxID=286 RepID=UPI0011C410EE|nr:MULTISPECIES: hypothetical protein [Pseudomonas]MBY8973068.1 hypothetical protein [Pseudomonas sp. P867]